MLKARSPFWALAKNRTISPPPPSRQGRLFPPWGGNSKISFARSLIPGLGVKLSTIVLAGPTVLSAVGACPPHDGVRRRWWINVESAVESAVALLGARKKSDDLT